jgi:hypothetical protein
MAQLTDLERQAIELMAVVNYLHEITDCTVELVEAGIAGAVRLQSASVDCGVFPASVVCMKLHTFLMTEFLRKSEQLSAILKEAQSAKASTSGDTIA